MPYLLRGLAAKIRNDGEYDTEGKEEVCTKVWHESDVGEEKWTDV